MLRLLTNTFLYRRLGRAIPNPIVRTLAIAGAGWAVRRLTSRRAAGTARRAASAPSARLGRPLGGR